MFFPLFVGSFNITQTLINWEIFQPILCPSLQSIDSGNSVGLGIIYVQFVKCFQLWREGDEGDNHLRVSGSRPGRPAMGSLSKLSDSVGDGGIICSWSKDELQQSVWNMRDFLSPWLMVRAKRQNNPLTSAIWAKSYMRKIPCLLGHTIPSPPLLLRLFSRRGHDVFSSWILTSVREMVNV